jgi:hypothetical protein
VTAKKPGRPPLEPPDRLSTPVHLRLTPRHYDVLSKLATQTRCTVPALIRLALRRELNFRNQE